MAEEKRRMVIFVEGGLIQDIYTDFPMDVYVLDADVEGSDEDLALIKDTDGTSNSYFLGHWEIPGEPKLTENFVEQIKAIEAEVQDEIPEHSDESV